jgi:hypothetical protein
MASSFDMVLHCAGRVPVIRFPGRFLQHAHTHTHIHIHIRIIQDYWL